MKRTPLNRGSSQLARKPIKRKRRQPTPVRDAYRQENHDCEVSIFLRRVRQKARRTRDDTTLNGLHEWIESLNLSGWDRPVEVDHIWGTTGGRLDLMSMLITVKPAWHEAKTANKSGVMLLFILVKHSKGEVNAAEFKQCSGMELTGWLTLDKTVMACPEWLEVYRLRLLSSLVGE